MKVTAMVESGKDGEYSIYTDDLKEALICGVGKTVADAKADLLEGFEFFLDGYRERGEEVPKHLKNVEFEYKYDVASILEAFPFFNVTELARHIGINPSLLRQYKRGNTYISAAKTQKILAKLQEIGGRLQSLSL